MNERSKWALSEAGYERITNKATAMWMAGRGNERFTLEHITALCAEEAFARPRHVAIEIVTRWMQEGKLLMFCARLFEAEAQRAGEHAEAINNLHRAVHGMLRRRQEDTQDRKRARGEK